MPTPLVRNFVGGEVTPEMFGRFDLAKQQTGLALCQNFEIRPHGVAESRAGFEFVKVDDECQLIEFAVSADENYPISFCAGEACINGSEETQPFQWEAPSVPGAIKVDPDFDPQAVVGEFIRLDTFGTGELIFTTGTTWNPGDISANIALSGGGLIATANDGPGYTSQKWGRVIEGNSGGKWYWEVEMTGFFDVESLGIATAAWDGSLSVNPHSYLLRCSVGQTVTPAGFGPPLGGFSSWCGVALDLVNNTVEWFPNGVSHSGPHSITPGTYYPAFHMVQIGRAHV